MHTLGVIFTLITALLHLYFLYLEMFLWTTPFGLKTFKMSPEQAKSSQVLAANQGVYNGLLAVGLLLSFVLYNPSAGVLRDYCLAFITLASIYGAYSVSYRIFLIQGVPAIIALIAFYVA